MAVLAIVLALLAVETHASLHPHYLADRGPSESMSVGSFLMALHGLNDIRKPPITRSGLFPKEAFLAPSMLSTGSSLDTSMRSGGALTGLFVVIALLVVAVAVAYVSMFNRSEAERQPLRKGDEAPQRRNVSLSGIRNLTGLGSPPSSDNYFASQYYQQPTPSSQHLPPPAMGPAASRLPQPPMTPQKASAPMSRGNQFSEQRLSSSSLTDDSILSEALLVKSPEGGSYVISGEIGPHPEEEIISVVDARNNETVAKVFVSETGPNPAIHVESANHVPAAIMDTSAAVHHEDVKPPENRYVNVHKPGGKLFARIHTEWGQTQSTCLVQRIGANDMPAGTLMVVRYDENEEMEQAVGPNGDVVARPQVQVGSDGSEKRSLWVKQGADFALVLCAALAFRKLS